MQVPTEYFLLCLGKQLKYSSCLYPAANSTLEEAEEAMLRESFPPDSDIAIQRHVPRS